MEITEITKLVTESGVGVASFIALLYLGWKLLQWLEVIKTNHLPHLQMGIDKLIDITEESVKLQRENSKSLDVNNNLLGVIINKLQK